MSLPGKIALRYVIRIYLCKSVCLPMEMQNCDKKEGTPGCWQWGKLVIYWKAEISEISYGWLKMVELCSN